MEGGRASDHAQDVFRQLKERRTAVSGIGKVPDPRHEGRMIVRELGKLARRV
jgi:hypothetical protein